MRALSFSLVMVGVIIEYLDIMLVSLFATSMATHFIGAQGESQKMWMGFIGYGISFLFRPLGAAVFGAMGDLVGKRKALLSSLLVMSLATLSLGLLPNFEKIGLASTALFVVFRVLQGLSIGGEYGAAMTYAYEIFGERKTLPGAFVISATHVGGIIAALTASIWTSFQSSFQIVGILGLASLLFRSLLLEDAPVKPGLKLRDVFKGVRPSLYVRSAVVASSLVFTFYATLIYLNEVIFQRGLAERSQIFRSNGFLLAMWIALPAALGYVTDHFEMSYKKMMIAGSIGVAVFSGPILWLGFLKPSFESIVLVQFAISLLHCLFCYATPRYFGDQFEAKTRNTGVSLSYSLGASFTAALTPLICHGVATFSGRTEAIFLPMAILSVLVVFFIDRSKI